MPPRAAYRSGTKAATAAASLAYAGGMIATIRDARPELRRLRRFLQDSAADLRHARGAALALFGAELRARHRRSWLGWLWLLAPAAALGVTAPFLSSQRVVVVGATELPYFVFVALGMLLWQTFLDGLNGPLEQLNRNRTLLTRSALPLEALIGAGVLGALLNLAIRMGAAAIILLVAPLQMGATALLLPFGAAALLLLGLAGGLALAPVGLLYEDVGRGLPLAAMLLFFVSPVAYPLPPGRVFALNPVAVLIDGTRGFVRGAGPSPVFLAIVAASAVALTFGWLFARLARPHVVARLG